MANTAFTIPNLITVARFMAIPLIVLAVLAGNWMTAFLLFAAAGISDAVDGYIARNFQQRSALGAVMDPLADKALTIAVYTVLAVQGQLPVWLVVLIVLRDVAILAGAGQLARVGRLKDAKPLFISKVNTAMLIVLAAWVLGFNAFGIAGEPVTGILVTVATVLIAASAFAYGKLLLDRIRKSGRDVSATLNQTDGLP
jgi:cardiolipin synthase